MSDSFLRTALQRAADALLVPPLSDVSMGVSDPRESVLERADCMHSIASFVDIDSLAMCMRVSSTWRELCDYSMNVLTMQHLHKKELYELKVYLGSGILASDSYSGILFNSTILASDSYSTQLLATSDRSELTASNDNVLQWIDQNCPNAIYKNAMIERVVMRCVLEAVGDTWPSLQANGRIQHWQAVLVVQITRRAALL